MQDRPCKTRQRRRAADMKSTYAREIDPSQLLTTSESGLHQPPTHVSSSNRRHLIIARFTRLMESCHAVVFRRLWFTVIVC